MADEDPSIEPFSLVTKDFPIVVIKENEPLTDDKRAELLDRLDELLESGKPHALIFDLTNAGELPEGQRVFISESLQMREELVSSLWISLAIVVPSSGANGELGSFWQKVSTAPTQVFTNTMSALVWTRQAVEKHVRAARASEDASAFDSPVSEPSPRRSDAAARRSKVTEQRGDPKRRDGKNAKRQTPSLTDRILFSPATWLAIGAIAICAALFALNSSLQDGLSSAEEQAFQSTKSKFSVRVFRLVDKRRVTIPSGGHAPPGSALRFEVDLPARAFMLIYGVRSNNTPYLAWPRDGKKSEGPLSSGKGILMTTVELDSDEGGEQLHFVACAEPIKSDACKFNGATAGFTCPESCIIHPFTVQKGRAGS